MAGSPASSLAGAGEIEDQVGLDLEGLGHVVLDRREIRMGHRADEPRSSGHEHALRPPGTRLGATDRCLPCRRLRRPSGIRSRNFPPGPALAGRIEAATTGLEESA
ncbi:MAG: hypothetical protein K0S06_512 [Microvirga sp.]|jgi:hypothetical protein|nr:hypothetical protein [Microvirga sp.]